MPQTWASQAPKTPSASTPSPYWYRGPSDSSRAMASVDQWDSQVSKVTGEPALVSRQATVWTKVAPSKRRVSRPCTAAASSARSPSFGSPRAAPIATMAASAPA